MWIYLIKIIFAEIFIKNYPIDKYSNSKMYSNLANQNPLVNNFNAYMTQNPTVIPFQNNSLINNNVHVLNNLNDLIAQNKNIQQNISTNQKNILQNTENTRNTSNKKTGKTLNIIEEMLKPQKITKDNNKDSEIKYRAKAEDYKLDKEGRLAKKFKITNAPYKNIIKDKVITKDVDQVKENDLLVHKSVRNIDANREKFDKELEAKMDEKDKINDELKIEFHIDNYDKHKKNFEWKETFIKNLAYEENTFDETKQDFIEFYRKKQKEAEEGKKICDQILHSIVDDGIINKEELPTEQPQNIDVNDILSTQLTGEPAIDFKDKIIPDEKKISERIPRKNKLAEKKPSNLAAAKNQLNRKKIVNV